MSRQQIHGRSAFDRPGFGEAQPSLQIQFHAPVRYENIRPPFHFFDDRSICLILDACRQATYERRGAYMNPFLRNGGY